jgi:hypothetical protein
LRFTLPAAIPPTLGKAKKSLCPEFICFPSLNRGLPHRSSEGKRHAFSIPAIDGSSDIHPISPHAQP